MSPLYYRKVYEVTGYAPRDGGYLLCVDCHAKAFPDHSMGPHADPTVDTCECGAVFLGSETDCRESCDTCHAEIETNVIGGGL